MALAMPRREAPATRLACALREHGPSLARSARRLCGNAPDADDLVHDVYERALRGEARAAEHANLRAYLHAILRNLYIDHCRSAGRRPTSVPLELMERGGSWRAAAADELEGEAAPHAQVSPAQLDAALAQLPEAFRVVFTLHVFERLTYTAIAQRLGIAPATVGTRLSRARSKLRRSLAHAQGARARQAA